MTYKAQYKAAFQAFEITISVQRKFQHVSFYYLSPKLIMSVFVFQPQAFIISGLDPDRICQNIPSCV